MLAEQCVKDVIDRMTIPNMKNLKAHIEWRIRLKTYSWQIEMMEKGRSLGLKDLQVIMPGNFTGLQFRWQGSNVDISIHNEKMTSESFGLGRHTADDDLLSSGVSIKNFMEHYNSLDDTWKERENDLPETETFISFVMEAWDNYKNTFLE